MKVSMDLDDYRCDCGRLLFRGALSSCRLEIKCRRCGAIKTFVAAPNLLKDGEKTKYRRQHTSRKYP